MNSGTGAILETVERVSSPIVVCDAELTDDTLKSVWNLESRKGSITNIIYIIVDLIIIAFYIYRFISQRFEHRYLTVLVFVLVFILVYQILTITVFRKKRRDQWIKMYRFFHGQRQHVEFDETAVTEVFKHGEETFELTTLTNAVQVKDFWMLYMGPDKKSNFNFTIVPISGFATEYEYSFFLDKIVGTANQNQA